MNYEFSPLLDSVRTRRKTKVWQWIIVVIFLVGLLTESFGFSVQLIPELLTVAGMLIVLAGLLAQVYFKRSSMTKFVKTNALQPLSHEDMQTLTPGSIASRGHGHRWQNGYEFNINSKSYKVFEYRYKTGSGKNQKTWLFTVGFFKTDKSYPHLFLDGIDNGRNWAYKQSQKIGLEGDFDKHFNLYAPEGVNIAALSIIAPDVMRTLILGGKPYDIEIEGKKVAVFGKNSLYMRPQLESLLNFMQSLNKEFAHKDTTWQPVFGANDQQLTLKRGGNWKELVIILGIVIVGIVVGKWLAAAMSSTAL